MGDGPIAAEEIRRHVEEICGAETSSLARARRIVRWVSCSIPWQAEDEYSTIPARWQSGFESRPATGIGMHDRAAIDVDPWGWLPADASYGVLPSADPRVADFQRGEVAVDGWPPTGAR